MSLKISQLEPVACDLCGGTRAKPVVTRPDGLHAVECLQCGLCYLNPRPSSEHIQGLYDSDYFSKQNGNVDSTNYGFDDYLSEPNQLLLKQTAAARLRLSSPYMVIDGKDCLEIGCATGEFCDLLQKRGAKVVGLDLADTAIAHGRARYPQIDFRCGDMSAVRNEELFDAIFAFEVVEHFESPIWFFAHAVSHLKPGGKLIVTTPNYNCGKRVGFNRWSGFQSSFEHLYFMSSQSINSYASKVGLATEVTLSGCGDGVEPSPRTDLRGVIRKELQALGILNLVRNYRPQLNRPTPDPIYLQQDDQHNLFMVLVKPAVDREGEEGNQA
jgi:2-polyprenyl-3-methyl-5-hydroxy-6-metoxy-1,4-benzoquinol methylase